jgi:hypothetical protein
MRLFPRSPWPGISVYAPAVDASAHCTLPDGGYDDDLHFPAPDAGPPVFE